MYSGPTSTSDCTTNSPDSAAVKPFRKWVTVEVPPAIRKTDSYQQPEMQSKPKSLAALRMAKSNGLRSRPGFLRWIFSDREPCSTERD